MELFETIAARGSKRKFTNEPVPRDIVKKCVEAAGRAPSPHNEQPWKFVAVFNSAKLNEMGKVVGVKLDRLFSAAPIDPEIARKVKWYSTFFADAPVVVAVLMRPYESVMTPVLDKLGLSAQELNEMRGMPDYTSVGAAVENFLLAATALGYGTCWLSGPVIARPELELALGVVKPWRLEALIAMGRPDGAITQAPKKPLSEIFEEVE